MKYIGASASEAMASRVIASRRSQMSLERSCQTLLTEGPEAPELSSGLASSPGSTAWTMSRRLTLAGGRARTYPPAFPRLLITISERLSSFRIWTRKLEEISYC